MAQSDAREIEAGKVKPKRRFDARDFETVSDHVIEEYQRRKRNRESREKQWAEIDRQLAMEPDLTFKKDGRGGIDHRKAWMAEMEMPLQAQALEVLTADARRLQIGDSGPWFRAHAEVTDEYLRRVEIDGLIQGDETEKPSLITQDNVDKLAQGYLSHIFRQWDFYTRLDRINAEGFKYGMGIGRGRLESKDVYIHEAKGTLRERQKAPILVPMGLKNVYLDDAAPSFLTSNALAPTHIAESWIRLEALQIAAHKGSSDPDAEDGGWMAKAVETLEPDRNGMVHLLELEGDLVVPRKTVRSVVLPGVIVTVAVGASKGGKVSRAMVRFRWRKQPFSSYLLFPYHYEGAEDHYPTSPLMKGRPLQIAATDALNRLMDAAALKNAPPVGYDRNDMWFSQQGGPVIEPHAIWQTTDPVTVYDKVGGDPAALSGVLSLAISLYAELTGVLPARLGAQTVSHTTAFAKEAEVQRAASRTVDYVSQTGTGPLTRWLDMAYRMGREALTGSMSFYIEDYDGFVKVKKEHLPERVSFEWKGNSEALEKAQEMQRKLAALQLALQMEQLHVSLGGQPTIDMGAAKREVLREGGWSDLDVIVRDEGPAGGPAAASQLPGAAAGSPGPAVAALQSIGSGQG